jgi:hypothetical protein
LQKIYIGPIPPQSFIQDSDNELESPQRQDIQQSTRQVSTVQSQQPTTQRSRLNVSSESSSRRPVNTSPPQSHVEMCNGTSSSSVNAFRSLQANESDDESLPDFAEVYRQVIWNRQSNQKNDGNANSSAEGI